MKKRLIDVLLFTRLAGLLCFIIAGCVVAELLLIYLVSCCTGEKISLPDGFVPAGIFWVFLASDLFLMELPEKWLTAWVCR